MVRYHTFLKDPFSCYNLNISVLEYIWVSDNKNQKWIGFNFRDIIMVSHYEWK
jgi:hypothetical protein